jgi:light-regulated signal transduction histidine kinase (bacteriophytochrome)
MIQMAGHSSGNMLIEKSSIETRSPDEQQQFLQSALHDLRAHQRGVCVAAELLLEAADDRERAALVDQIKKGLTKTEHLLNAIDRYASALTPSLYSITLFPSASAVRFAIANLDHEIQEANAAVTVGELPEIQGDRRRLTELFENLLSNSIKFHGQDPPEIEIAAGRAPDGWLFSVTDNGIGIPEKYRDRLFVPFRRLHGADVPGAGLGLAASRKIAEGHGGRIWIDSPAAAGARFCILLPAADGI